MEFNSGLKGLNLYKEDAKYCICCTETCSTLLCGTKVLRLTVNFLCISINQKTYIVYLRNFFYVHVGIINWLRLINIDMQDY